MAEREEIKQNNQIQEKSFQVENNFDVGEKNETQNTQSDNVKFFDDPKYQDIKETLSQTINELSKGSKIKNFDQNIQSVVETIFSDRILRSFSVLLW